MYEIYGKHAAVNPSCACVLPCIGRTPHVHQLYLHLANTLVSSCTTAAPTLKLLLCVPDGVELRPKPNTENCVRNPTPSKVAGLLVWLFRWAAETGLPLLCLLLTSLAIHKRRQRIPKIAKNIPGNLTVVTLPRCHMGIVPSISEHSTFSFCTG